MTLALSLFSFLRRKPKAPPSKEDLRKIARFLWLSDHGERSFLRYAQLEPDEKLRIEAAFQFLFNASNYLAKQKLFTNDMRRAAAWPHSRTVLQHEFHVVEPVLCPLLENLPSLDGALLQNITVARMTSGWENSALLLELCLERMALIHVSYGRISPAAAEIVIAFTLGHLAEISSYDVSISRWWQRMLEIAEQFAAHRTPPGLTRGELLNLRQALVSSAPHHAQVVQEKLMDLPA